MIGYHKSIYVKSIVQLYYIHYTLHIPTSYYCNVNSIYITCTLYMCIHIHRISPTYTLTAVVCMYI